MDDLRLRCEFIEITGDSVIESGSDGEEYITVTNCHIGIVFAM